MQKQLNGENKGLSRNEDVLIKVAITLYFLSSHFLSINLNSSKFCSTFSFYNMFFVQNEGIE